MKPSLFIFSLLFVLSCMLMSCNGQEESIGINDAEVPKDFSDFYIAFHSDSVYQMDHILFPLSGRPAVDSSNFSDDEFKWEQENWKIHNFDHFNPDEYNVTRKVTDSTLVTEVISDKTSGFGIKRRFARFSGKWYLIYYDAMNPAK